MSHKIFIKSGVIPIARGLLVMYCSSKTLPLDSDHNRTGDLTLRTDLLKLDLSSCGFKFTVLRLMPPLSESSSSINLSIIENGMPLHTIIKSP